MSKFALALACSAVMALGLAACGSDDSTSTGATDGASATQTTPEAAGDGKTLTIKVFRFEPQELTVQAGTKVTVSNQDEILHTWTSGTRTDAQSGAPKDTPDGTFDVTLDGKGSDGSFTFDEPGRYEYYCSIHPGNGMTGTVVVE